MTELRREIAVERTTSNGQKVVITVCLDSGLYGCNALVETTLDGVQIDNALGLGVLQAPKQHPNGRITHYAGSGKSAVAVFEAEAVRVAELQAELRAHYETTPEGLLNARRRLSQDVTIAMQIDREDRDAAWGRENEQGGVREDAAGKVAAARKALGDFDAAHPEIKQQLDAADESRRAAELADQISYRGE